MAGDSMWEIDTHPSVTSPLHRVTVDDVARELPADMVLVANCGELVPPFLRLRHDIAPDDGWLDVVVLRAEGVFQSLSAFLELVRDRKSTRLNSSHQIISYAVFCLKKKNNIN